MKTPLGLRRTNQFAKDYKVLSRQFPNIRKELEEAIKLLRSRSTLPARFRDHPLSGRLLGLRDCHVRGDVVLIYCVEEKTNLVLVRVGTHAQLGL